MAYYRRALPRFLQVRELLSAERHRPAHLRPRPGHRSARDRRRRDELAIRSRRTPARDSFSIWRRTAWTCSTSWSGRSPSATGFALNTGGTYAAEDVTSAAFRFTTRCRRNRHLEFPRRREDRRDHVHRIEGTLVTPVFTDGDVVVSDSDGVKTFPVRNPPHVHQPLIQTIVDELRGQGRCASTGESAARTSWVMDRCLEGYYQRR